MKNLILAIIAAMPCLMTAQTLTVDSRDVVPEVTVIEDACLLSSEHLSCRLLNRDCLKSGIVAAMMPCNRSVGNGVKPSF